MPSEITIETRQQCRHIFTDGRRCGSPTIRGPHGADTFCYYHHNARRPIHDAPARRRRQSRFALPNPEDRSAIQQALGQILQRIASNDIDPRRAGLLLYGLQIASLNLPKSNPAEPPAEIVSEVTHDPEHGLLAPPAELHANQPKSSMQLLLDDLQDEDSEEVNPTAASIDIEASATSGDPAESTPRPQTTRPAHPSKSHRPSKSLDRQDALKVRSHEPRSTHHRNAPPACRARAVRPTIAQPRTSAAPDLHLRRSGCS